MKKIIALLFISASAVAAQNINPVTQITWPRVTGNGAPSLICGSIEYGMPYTDLSQNPAVNYHCTIHGWQTDGGGGSVGPGTVGYYALFSTTTNVGNGHLNENSNPGSITATIPVEVVGTSGNSGYFWVGVGNDPGGTAGQAWYTTDGTNGYAEVNEGHTARSRFCTAANGVCQPPTTFQTGGVNNSSQTTLNLVAGANVTITNSSGGNVTIAATGGGGSYPTPVTVSGTGVTELDLTGCITSSNRDYDIRFSQITFTSGSAVTLYIQFSSNNGSTWDTASNYNTGRNFQQLFSGSTVGTSTSQNSIGIVPTMFAADTFDSGDILDIRLSLNYPMNTTAIKMGGVKTQSYYTSGPNAYNQDGSFYYTGSSAVNAVRLVTTGTFTGQATCQPLPQ